MSQHAGFLRAILDAPDDDTPRLIYADWLDEHGNDPLRAELIRVQCEIHRTPPHEELRENPDLFDTCSCRWCVLKRRARELLLGGPNRPAGYSLPIYFRWVEEPLASLPDAGYVFSRGFIGSVEMTCEEWLKHGATMVGQMPLREVTLRDKRPEMLAREVTNTASGGVRQHIITEWRWHSPYGDEPYNLPMRLLWNMKGGLELSYQVDTTRLPREGEVIIDRVIYGRAYGSEAEAVADLSDACLAWAKEKAANRKAFSVQSGSATLDLTKLTDIGVAPVVITRVKPLE